LKKYDLEILNKILFNKNETKEQKRTRLKLLGEDLFVFSIYYFTDLFSHKASDYQKEICEWLDWDLNLLIIGYRWSAKTTYTIIKIIQSICYNTSNFIMFFCAEKSKATARLYDIVVHLQTNKRLKEDFWELFPKQRNKNNQGEDFNQKKSIPEFITTNQIKVKASSIWESPRWEIFFNSKWSYRPDFIVLDDIDTEKTTYSITQIEKNYSWLKWELIWSLSKSNYRIIFLWNVIKSDWIVPRFENDYKQNSNWKILKKALIEDWQITWDYFTESDIERLKKEQGTIAFNQNYLLIPFSWWETIIKRSNIKYFDYNIINKFDRVVLWIDPAISEKETSDDFWICVIWYIWDDIYVLECFWLKGTEKLPQQAINTIKQLYTKYNANLVSVETVAYQKVLFHLLKNEWLATNEVKTNKDKMTNLLERQFLFENWKVYFSKNCNELVEQLLNFPNVLHDDLVDAFIIWTKQKKYFLF